MEQHEYLKTINGLPHTYLLTVEQAAERGLTDDDRVKPKAAPAPKNKARTARDK